MNKKVEQNKKSDKKEKIIPFKVNIPLWAYNMCWYIYEEHKDLLNEAQIDELFLRIYTAWPYYKSKHQIYKKSGD